MRKLLVSVFLLSLTGTVFAVDLKLTVPVFGTDNPFLQDYLQEFNEEAKRAFEGFQESITSELEFLPDSVPNLARAFANTSVFSSDGASQRGYEGYKAFSLTAGFMGALQFPRNFAILDGIMDGNSSGEGEIFDFIKDNMDIGLGLDAQVLNAQLGINTSGFLLKNLYLGLKFSMFDSNWIKAIPISGFSFKTMSVGITANYQLINQVRLLGLLVWRGLNLGTGFVWQNTSLGFTPALPIDEDLLNFSFGPIEHIGTISMHFNQVFRLGIDTNTYIIPIQAMTSLRLLFLNVALGAGVDIAFGNTNINAHGSIDLDSYDLPDDVYWVEEPSLSFGLGGKSAPGIFNLKIMGALGFNFGPVIIDIPVTYYFVDNGYSLGITFGLTF